MTQELGRISRPSAAQYQGRRKLLLVPLVYGPPNGDADGAALLQRYWQQAQIQVATLEVALGPLQHIYHESLTSGGEEGLEQLGATDQRSHRFVRDKSQLGVVLEATEDLDLLLETLDLQRCLMMPLASPAVAAKLQDWYAETNRKRYQHIAARLDETLGENEMGALLISERHQVQFPSDIEVFYVSPPALDDFRRWMQNWAARQQSAAAASDFDPTSAEPTDDAPAGDGATDASAPED